MAGHKLKTCKKCHDDLDEDKFDWANKSKLIRRNVCAKCRDQKEWQDIKQDSNRLQKRNNYSQQYRAANPAISFLRDSKSSDKKKSRQNDLDINIVKDLLSKPCSYCGETKLRITLDRIDNSIGHLKSNVVPACIRCNYTRRDMPYEAWLYLTESMRKAREAGAFDNWTGSIWK